MIGMYGEARKSDKQIIIPELFIWHAFLGLADGLAYLQGGKSYINEDMRTTWRPVKGWIPLLHRDVKPDNVLLRSRSTMGSQKYFYCILSDFGLCCQDDGTDPWQTSTSMLGTPHWWAPELLWDPYPANEEQQKSFVTTHSNRSDVWALSAMMYDMANPDPHYVGGYVWGGERRLAAQHLNFRNKPKGYDVNKWTQARASRKELVIGNEYSKYLRDAIQLGGCMSVARRPNAMDLVRSIRAFMEEGKIEATGPRSESDKLAPWATRVHDYHHPRPPPASST